MAKKTDELINYQWEGVNSSGQLANGDIEARSIVFAKTELRKKGITIKKISKKRKPLLDRKNKKITGPRYGSTDVRFVLHLCHSI